MRRHRQDQEQVIRKLLARLGDDVGDPTEAELRRAARLAAGEGRTPQERPASHARPWRPLRLRWAAGGAATLLVATGLAFGVASWLTPTSSARTVVEGFGFLPATGWTVIQVGLGGSAESTRMVAANVPMSPGDPRRGQPLALHALPPWTIVIDATLKARGEPARDAAFPVRSLPLTLADARPVTVPGQPTLGVRAPCGSRRLQRRRQRHLRQRAHGCAVRQGRGADRAPRRRAGGNHDRRPADDLRPAGPARRLGIGDEREGRREGDAAVQAVRPLPGPVPRPARGDDTRGRRLVARDRRPRQRRLPSALRQRCVERGAGAEAGGRAPRAGSAPAVRRQRCRAVPVLAEAGAHPALPPRRSGSGCS